MQSLPSGRYLLSPGLNAFSSYIVEASPELNRAFGASVPTSASCAIGERRICILTHLREAREPP